jgi:hypothetical protein
MNYAECQQYDCQNICCNCQNRAYAKKVDELNLKIAWLERGLYNCFSSDFYICPHCGEIATKNYVCWKCGKDPESRKDLQDDR